MKKNCTTKNRIKDGTQKRHISETKISKSKPRAPMNHQQFNNALTAQKSVAVYLKDSKTGETFSSQAEKLVETTNLW